MPAALPPANPPGRNDPCHCGSGLKYKKCHADADRAAAGMPALRLLANAPAQARERTLGLPSSSELNAAWEIDIVPLPATFADDPTARPAAIVVAAPPFVVACDVDARPPAEPDELAALLAHQVLTAAANAGRMPSTVALRHPSLVAPLNALLAPNGAAAVFQDELPGVADAVRSLLAHVVGSIAPLPFLRAQPETWAGWGMPPELNARMFRAAAEYFRARPWDLSPYEIPVEVTRPGGNRWTTVIIGAQGEQLGLACYERASDFDGMADAPQDDPAAAVVGLRGMVMSLLFNTRSELPRAMRDEIRREGWEVAGPEAYPTLAVLNTPGGGLRRTYFEDLIAALEAMPRFLHADLLTPPGPAGETYAVDWTDPVNGVRCTVDLTRGEEFPEMMPPELLLPACADGPGARPLATLSEKRAEAHVDELLVAFFKWLPGSPSGRPLTPKVVARDASVADLFLELCVRSAGKPIGAVNEADLREFLYDWYPRKVQTSLTDARTVRTSLKRFFRFLEEERGILCSWAESILADQETFELRWESFPGGFFWDEGVQEWQRPFVLDLALRALMPVMDDRSVIEWGETMGRVEFTLYREVRQRCVVWRDEAIRRGTREPPLVVEHMVARQNEWATAPNKRCGGLTPVEAILKERNERSGGGE